MVENNSHAQQRLEQHVKLAQFTFSQITEETLAYKDVLPMSSQHVHLYSALWRRREFWVKQLEETWTEWNMATERMHKADSDAAEMWLYLVDLSMKALHVEPLEAEAALVEGLAKVAARAFIAEFLQLGSQNDFFIISAWVSLRCRCFAYGCAKFPRHTIDHIGTACFTRVIGDRCS